MLRDASSQSQALRAPPGSAPRVGLRSSYYFGPPPQDSAFGTAPVGVIGRDKPREIIRVERDYTSGELCQFHPSFPLELEGRVSPTHFSETINDINVLLIEANSPGWACFDNTLAALTLYISPFLFGSKYKREMARLQAYITKANKESFNPAGLNIIHPRHSAFLFMEIEYF
ncbi:hypothetical protein K437DRAFT_221999 [Tilletiaria anomala UBC 951]|uniref:Ras modification protein ERF4 n=1 Tax=Tilletiaria anomala (strain ATCC 24038 / CBS 436.72 / UBC 951) TaxID=1037660 RepID=A0A066WH56_TILAU|nr:uncharacterized protein K437DRAFT_221999 [Tilletiaria anomala UBC 951]KDN50364.1 hypothetical protein K437DRAFT_221999 [Tilletiaria anomala UBC 951]